MTVLSVIFGILMVGCGIYSLFTPLLNFVDMAYLIVILSAVYGIIGIVRCSGARYFGVGFVFSILSLIFAIALLIFPRMMVVTTELLLYIAAGWIVLMSVVSIISAIQFRKISGIWVLQLIFGIIGVILGCYTFFHPGILAISIGWLVGFWFIETGFSMIFFSARRL